MKALFLFLITLLFVTPSSGKECYKSINNLFKGVNTAYIFFKQKSVLPITGDNITLYKGEIFYKRPLQFIWRYTWGSKMEIVSDGKFIETCFDDGSCQTYSLNEESDLFPILLIVESPEIFFSKYQVVKVKQNKNAELYEFKAKDEDYYFKKVTLFFEKGTLKSFKVVQRDGTEETFIVEKIKLNIPIDSTIFRVKAHKK